MARRTYHLSRQDRVVLALYRAAPSISRAVAVNVLWETFAKPFPHERDAINRRFEGAVRQLRLGPIPLSVINRLREVK